MPLCPSLSLSLYVSLSDSVSFSLCLPSPHTLLVCFSYILFLPVLLGISLCPRYSISYSCLSVFSSFLPLVTYLFLPPSSLLPRPAEHTNSQIPKRPGRGSTPRPIFWAPPGTETSLLGARGVVRMETTCPCMGCGVEAAQCGAQGPASLPGVRGRCRQPERKEAAGLDRESCGRPSPYLVLWVQSVEFLGVESTSSAFTGSHRRRYCGQTNTEA